MLNEVHHRVDTLSGDIERAFNADYDALDDFDCPGCQEATAPTRFRWDRPLVRGVECVHHVEGNPCPVGLRIRCAGPCPDCLQMFWAVSAGGAAAGSLARLFGDVAAVVDELAEGAAEFLRILRDQIDLIRCPVEGNSTASTASDASMSSTSVTVV